VPICNAAAAATAAAAAAAAAAAVKWRIFYLGGCVCDCRRARWRVLAIDRLGAAPCIARPAGRPAVQSVGGRAGVVCWGCTACSGSSAATLAADAAVAAADFHRSFVRCSAMRRPYAR